MKSNYEEFNKLYIELMKVRQDNTNGLHILLNNNIKVYVCAEIVNYYVRTGKFDLIDYISVDENGETNYKDIDFDYILPIMAKTLKEWRKQWKQY